MDWKASVLLTLALVLAIVAIVRRLDFAPAVERFAVLAPGDAVDWLRAGLLALKYVPSLQLPDVTKSKDMTVMTVPVTESRVWLDMCAPASDGILRLYPVDSLGDLVINRKHPHAEYMLKYDDKLVALSTAGRYKASGAFRSSFSELESHAFPNRRDVDDQTTVYSITPAFATDVAAAQAVYDFLLAVSLLRTCLTNGSLVDDILAALADHGVLVQRNRSAMAKLQGETRRDLQKVNADSSARMKSAVADMRDKYSAADAGVRGAQAHSAELGRNVSSLAHTKGNMALKTDSDTATIARNKLATAQSGVEADYSEAQRKHADTDLQIVRTQLADYENSRRNEEASLGLQAMAGNSDAQRGVSIAERLKPAADGAETDASRLEQARALALQNTNRYRAEMQAASASLQTALVEIRKVQETVAQSKQSEESKRAQLAQLEAERKQLSDTAAAHKQRAEQEVQTAMDANVDASKSYALWDRYASLTRIQDDIDAMNDGLPI